MLPVPSRGCGSCWPRAETLPWNCPWLNSALSPKVTALAWGWAVHRAWFTPLLGLILPPYQKAVLLPHSGLLSQPWGPAGAFWVTVSGFSWRKSLRVRAGAKHRVPWLGALGGGRGPTTWLSSLRPSRCITDQELGQIGWEGPAPGSCGCGRLSGSAFHVPGPPTRALFFL